MASPAAGETGGPPENPVTCHRRRDLVRDQRGLRLVSSSSSGTSQSMVVAGENQDAPRYHSAIPAATGQNPSNTMVAPLSANVPAMVADTDCNRSVLPAISSRGAPTTRRNDGRAAGRRRTDLAQSLRADGDRRDRARSLPPTARSFVRLDGRESCWVRTGTTGEAVAPISDRGRSCAPGCLTGAAPLVDRSATGATEGLVCGGSCGCTRGVSGLHDADRTGVEVALERFGAAFGAVAGFLHTAEGHFRRGHGRHVDPQHADLDASGELVGPGE